MSKTKNAAKVQHYANVVVTLNLMVPVDAPNLEEALQAARALKPLDVVDIPEGTDANDWEIKLTGVWQ